MGGLGRKSLHKLPDMEILRNLESPFILWIQIDIYFLASTNYSGILSTARVEGSPRMPGESDLNGHQRVVALIRHGLQIA